MSFGKKGRPPEDVLARQREIYEAVSPLILQIGARQLSMRQAARAACLSIGGLYHYFPTKRALVLHGLSPEALTRWCHEFHAQYTYLLNVDPEEYLDRCLDDIVQVIKFVRPAFHAATELGAEAFWNVIEGVLTFTTQEFTMILRRLVPEGNKQELSRLEGALRRAIVGGVLDKTATDDEIREELCALLKGYRSHAGQEWERSTSLSIKSTI